MIYSNLEKLAVALKYKKEDDRAPHVVASGQGKIAEKIIQTAIESEVPIHRDQPLAEVLQKVQVGKTIPEELYQVVAEVIAMVYNINQKWNSSNQNSQ